MRGQIKFTLLIYLIVFLFSVTELQAPGFLYQKTVTEIKVEKLTTNISTKYKVPEDYTKEIVEHAYQLGSSKGFPTALDILAIIAIESSFNKYAVSKSNAIGLMQIKYVPSSFEVRQNLIDGVRLLRIYNQSLQVDAAIQAYNLGIGNYKKGMRNSNYLMKFNTVKQQLERI